MTTHRLALRLALAAVACASITACADRPSRQADLDYHSRAPSTARGATTSDSSNQRLTIQSGAGERLNLPWFVQDAQDLVNSN